MLDAMRQASRNWIGRTVMALVMGFIILSFAVWGIGDIFKGFGGNTLAKVGSTEITADAFRSAYQLQLQRLQQQQRRPITNEQARAMGLDGQVLGKLISDAVLDDRARALGLGMSNEEIVRTAMEDPTFRGASGKFDPEVFQSILRDNGLTEAMFVRDQRGVYLRRAIADALAGSLTVPHVALDAIQRFRNETRCRFEEVLRRSEGRLARA
jgi:peptidyl-prolyl cis-trans isomerase D